MTHIQIPLTCEELEYIIDGVGRLEPNTDEGCDFKVELLYKLEHKFNHAQDKGNPVPRIDHDGNGSPV